MTNARGKPRPLKRSSRTAPSGAERNLFELALHGARDGMWDWDANSGRVFRNHRVQAILGLEPVDSTENAADWPDRIHPDDRARYRGAVRAVFKSTESQFDCEYRVRHAGGGYRWLHDRAAVLRDARGKVYRMAGWIGDITQRKEADEALRESEQRFRLLVASVRDYAIFLLDSDGRVVSWNEGAARIKGYKPHEIIGQHFSRFYEPEDVANGKPIRGLETAAREGRFEDEGRRVRKDGSRFWASVVITALYDDKGKLYGFAKVTRDITERALAEAERRRQGERLKLLSAQLIDLQEVERRHIALELHDQIGQALTALKINLETLQRGSPDLARMPRITESVEIVAQLIQEVRDLSLALRPSILDDFGLVPALRWYGKRQAERGAFKIEILEEGAVGRLPPAVETACFRIAQEALTNIGRHAKAGLVKLALHRNDESLHLAIDDDGIGFNPADLRGRLLDGHSHGVVGMEERARLAGGKLDIASTAGQGTQIRAQFTLNAPNPADASAERAAAAAIIGAGEGRQ